MTRTAVRHSPTLVFLFIGVADVVLAFIGVSGMMERCMI